jgi:hypothetical protein
MFQGPRQDEASSAGVPSAEAPSFEGLRRQILELDPAQAGLLRAPDGPLVWGALLETAYPKNNGVGTLVALADGTTSVYTSGGGIIGGGGHQAVVAANQSFLAAVEHDLAQLTPDADDAVPGPGRVIIRALTYQGRYSAGAAADDIGDGRHPLSVVFRAGHGVLTQLRLLHEAPPASGGTRSG